VSYHENGDALPLLIRLGTSPSFPKYTISYAPRSFLLQKNFKMVVCLFQMWDKFTCNLREQQALILLFIRIHGT